jgi:hypothetical protein
MHRVAAFVLLVCGMGFIQPALARPPQDALPLSQIIQSLEQQGEIAFFDEIQWDDDGYWEIEYYTAAGAKVKVKVDPVSGKPSGR